MTEENKGCQSCGMTIESGPYCSYCLDERGELQAFDERFERMSQFMHLRLPDLDDATVEQRTLQYMASMPAWRDHPRVLSRQSGKIS